MRRARRRSSSQGCISELTSGGTVTGRTYDIAADGQRFLMLKEGGTADPDDPLAGLTQIHVVQNWFEELKARVPTGQ